MHSPQLGIVSEWWIARKAGKSGTPCLARTCHTSHSFVEDKDSVCACAHAERDARGVAACGAPDEWPDVDSGALPGAGC